MADSISFLVCLDGAGQLRWKRAAGGKSTTGGRPTLLGAGRGRDSRIAFVEVDGDRSFRPGAGTLDSLRERILVCDLGATIQDSLEIPPGVRVSELKSVWHSGLGEHVVWLGLGGNTLQMRNETLGLLSELQHDSRISLLTVHDLLSTGTPQYLVATMDGRLWLLTDRFEPLAVLLNVQSPVLRGVLSPDATVGAARIVLEADAGRSNIVLRLRKAPWHAIFTRHPILAFAAAFIPLSAIIGLIWTVMLRFRQKNRLIERQRDELTRAMHDLREAQDKLIEAEKLALTNDIAGGVAHEIRNALDPAVHCLHALNERLTPAADSADTRRLVDLSAQAVRRAVSMTRLIREFADLAKTGPSEPVDAAYLFAEIVARHAERIEAIGAKVDLDLPAGIKFNGPATHTDVLFNNLIVNALDAIAGSAERRIVVRGTVSGTTARISVADSGPGIPESDRTRVFHAFYSTKPSTGMGLGLTFSKRIAEILGGSLTLGPKSERGAEFLVELPTT
jgi:signal transduction histidine kinase